MISINKRWTTDLLISPQAMEDIRKWDTEMEKSTHKMEVVPVVMEKHPNADTLSIIPIFGYSYCGRTEDWVGKSKAAWCPPDSLVDTTRSEFVFLAGEAKYNADSTLGGVYARIRAKKLRGVPSYGLLVPVPNDTELGTDMAEVFGINHYEPVVAQSSNKDKTGFYSGGETASGPTVLSPKYDLDSFQRYAKQVFVDEEPVVVTEKINGANARYVYENGQMYCGSHYEWKKEFPVIPVPDKDKLIETIKERIQRKPDWQMEKRSLDDLADEQVNTILTNIQRKNEHPPQNLFWKAMRNTPGLAEWCEAHPGLIVYGEVYGAVKGFTYGNKQGEVKVLVFDIMDNGRWLDFEDARKVGENLPWVPVLHTNYPYNFDKLVEMAEGNTLISNANHIREGIVVAPIKERYGRYGRPKLKIVSLAYFNK